MSWKDGPPNDLGAWEIRKKMPSGLTAPSEFLYIARRQQLEDLSHLWREHESRLLAPLPDRAALTAYINKLFWPCEPRGNGPSIEDAIIAFLKEGA